MPPQFTVIGCGVFGRAIIDGLTSENGKSQLYSIALTHRRSDAVAKLKQDYTNIFVTQNNEDAHIWSSPKNQGNRHIVVIATQPEYTAEVCNNITRAFTAAVSDQQLVVVTVCPGITIDKLESWLPPNIPIVRTMPNTPIAVRQGATAIFANCSTPLEVISEVRAIFQTMSPIVATLPREDLMDIAASVSGSAPAYFYYVMQSLIAAGDALGLPSELGRQLVVQSCLGAAAYAQHSTDTPMPQLLADVCVEGGSTEKAMRVMDQHDTETTVMAAVEESLRANRNMNGGSTGTNGTVSTQFKENHNCIGTYDT